MNDLDLVRTVLSDTPPASAARLATGRQRLLAATTGSRERGSRRLSWRVLLPAGAVAVATAAAVAAFAVSGGGTVPKVTRPVPRSAASVSPASLAAKVLADAARTVASEPVTEPAAGQWIYCESVSAQNGTLSGSPDQEWITFDGTESAYYGVPRAGAQTRLIIHHEPAAAIPSASPGGSALAAFDSNSVPLTAYNALASLPAGPSALLAAVDADIVAGNQTMFGVMGPASGTPQREFGYLGQLLWNSYAAAPPSALAAVYQAIATIPGVTVMQGVTDAAGHPAISVSDNGGATQLLLDPRTYQVVGISLSSPPVIVKTVHGKVTKGGGTSSIAYLRIAEVNAPGQR